MISKEKIIEILTKNKILSSQDLERLIKIHQEKGGSFSQLLITEGLVTESSLTVLLSTELGIPALGLSALKIDPTVAKLIPRKLAEHYELIPVSKIGNTLTVAMSDPLNVFALDDLKKITKCQIRPIIASSRDIQNALESYYSAVGELEDLIDEIDVDDVTVVGDIGEKEGAVEIADDAPVIKTVSLILQEAIKQRASDIHFERYRERFRIRYRVDGTLKEVLAPPRDMHASILARIKILSDLDITEKRLPQDGRFKIRTEGKEIDFRVSILPTTGGEKAVLRILDKSNLMVGLDKLGFSSESLEAFRTSIKKPYGMLLVTGPTGSGKSTTLYSVLNTLNTPERNIMTIEDPIEYQLEGVTQTQVNPDIGLTFANGLRSLIRQNPDIILVGEIRDSETADIAVKAALTGHLVFSTLHTNNACGAITRLIDMGVESFLIASSLVMVAAQRLCRKICPNCKEECDIPLEVLDRINVDRKTLQGVTAYSGSGCKTCGGTGYYGRMGTLEVLIIDDEIRSMIIDRVSSGEIERVARRKGMRTLFEDAFEKFKLGQATLEEVLRITSEE